MVLSHPLLSMGAFLLTLVTHGWGRTTSNRLLRKVLQLWRQSWNLHSTIWNTYFLMGNVNMKACLLEQRAMRAVTYTSDQRQRLGTTVLDCAGNLMTSIKTLQTASKISSCSSLTCILTIIPLLKPLKSVLIRAIFLHSS